MRALFIQHDPGARPGLVGAALERHGIEVVGLEMAASVHNATWRGAFPAAMEEPHSMLTDRRVTLQASRFAQVGSWEGWIEVDDDKMEVTHSSSVAARQTTRGRDAEQPRAPGCPRVTTGLRRDGLGLTQSRPRLHT